MQKNATLTEVVKIYATQHEDNVVLYLTFQRYTEIVTQKLDQFNSLKMKSLHRKDEEQPQANIFNT